MQLLSKEEKRGGRALSYWAKTMEIGKKLEKHQRKSSGIWGTVCMKGVSRNWGDPTYHQVGKEEPYK